MAQKLVFISSKDCPFDETLVDYEFVPGFAPSQRQKNVANLHKAILYHFPNKKVLEISTKSDSELGRMLSAFNLKFEGHYFESIFQSSKVFEDGTQYEFLIDKTPLEAKRYIQNAPKQEITKFRYKGKDFPINPQSAFYDFLYCNALSKIPEFSGILGDFDIFTDIEFNYKKSINCQARACAIYSYLLKINQVEPYIKDFEHFLDLYNSLFETISLF